MNLEWFRGLLSGLPGAEGGGGCGAAPRPSTTLNALLEGLPAGEGDPLFIPHLGGRVCPGRPELRGAWAGLDWSHGPLHLYRAVLEGVALEYGLYLAVLRELDSRAAPRGDPGHRRGGAQPGLEPDQGGHPGHPRRAGRPRGGGAAGRRPAGRLRHGAVRRPAPGRHGLGVARGAGAAGGGAAGGGREAPGALHRPAGRASRPGGARDPPGRPHPHRPGAGRTARAAGRSGPRRLPGRPAHLAAAPLLPLDRPAPPLPRAAGQPAGLEGGGGAPPPLPLDRPAGGGGGGAAGGRGGPGRGRLQGHLQPLRARPPARHGGLPRRRPRRGGRSCSTRGSSGTARPPPATTSRRGSRPCWRWRGWSSPWPTSPGRGATSWSRCSASSRTPATATRPSRCACTSTSPRAPRPSTGGRR